MEKPVNHLVIATFILLVITAIVLSAAARTGNRELPVVTTPAESEAQEAMIRKNYLLNTLLRPNQLEISVAQGHATLSGRVDHATDREMAEKIALAVEGIVTVDNRIVVESDYLPTRPYKPRSQGTPTDDANISTAILATLQWSDYRKALAVDVSTQNGVVTLDGTAQTPDALHFAVKTAEATAGVVAVTNRLALHSSTPLALRKLLKDSDQSRRVLVDAWITVKVKAQLLHSGLTRSSDIEVSTHSGVVSLRGSVTDDQAHARVIELAQNTQGVHTVLADDLAR